jgi:hypothetical protein
MRHDKGCAHLHHSVCKALGFETTDKWYTHMPKPVYEEGDVTVLWYHAVHTDREVTANRPDIIIIIIYNIYTHRQRSYSK